MKNYSLALVLLSCLLSFSCSDDDISNEIPEDAVPEKTTFEFANLEVGNYWIYDVFLVTEEGEETQTAEADSVFIVGDTIIGDKRLLIHSGYDYLVPGNFMIFDSANTIFTYPRREVLFTLDESVVVEKDEEEFNGAASAVFGLESTPSTVSVPAGDFECLNYQGFLTSTDPDTNIVRTSNRFYSEDVGLILRQDQFLSTGTSLDARLIRFGSN